MNRCMYINKIGTIIKLFLLFLVSLFTTLSAHSQNLQEKEQKKELLLQELTNKFNTTQDLREIIEFLESQELSPSDLRRVEDEFRKPEYKKKIEMLFEKEAYKGDIQKNINTKRPSDESLHLKQRNKGVRLSPASLNLIAPNTRLKSPLTITNIDKEIGISSDIIDERISARISNIYPTRIRVNERVEITGHDFGAQTGRVAAVIGSDMIYLPILQWKDGFIEALVPADAEFMIGNADKEGKIWVKVGDGHLGPRENIIFTPDLEKITPEIHSLSSTKLRPEKIITISGKNFNKYFSGEVVLDVDDLCILDHVEISEDFRMDEDEYDRIFRHQFSTHLLNWTDSLIQIKITNDFVGFLSGQAELVLKNHHELEARVPVYFEHQNVVSTSMCGGGFDSGWGDKLYLKSTADDWCVTGKDDQERPYPSYYMLPEHFEFVDFALQGSWSSATCPFFGYGSEILFESEKGRRDFKFEAVIWANLLATYSARITVFVRGPYYIRIGDEGYVPTHVE